MIVRHFSSLIFVVLCACSLTTTTELPQPPTSTTVRVAPSTLVPTVSRLLNEIALIEPSATPVSPIDCQQTAGQPATQHQVIANLNYEQGVLLVQQSVRYINRSNGGIDAACAECGADTLA